MKAESQLQLIVMAKTQKNPITYVTTLSEWIKTNKKINVST